MAVVRQLLCYHQISSETTNSGIFTPEFYCFGLFYFRCDNKTVSNW
jgi:hypothetical protein